MRISLVCSVGERSVRGKVTISYGLTAQILPKGAYRIDGTSKVCAFFLMSAEGRRSLWVKFIIISNREIGIQLGGASSRGMAPLREWMNHLHCGRQTRFIRCGLVLVAQSLNCVQSGITIGWEGQFFTRPSREPDGAGTLPPTKVAGQRRRFRC